MREIKFRAWREKRRMMLAPHSLIELFQYGGIVNPDDVVWMQYTGLKDKSGVEIYEGDVLSGKSKVFGDTSGDVRISRYLDVEEYMHQYHLGWNISGIPLIDLVDDGLEVIGNIHMNPELLEK